MGHTNYYTDPAKKLFYQKTNFMNGINNTTADDLVPDTYEKNLVNFDLSYAGALTKRAGFISHTNASYLPKLNEFNDFENYPTLLKDKNQKLFKDLSMQQGIFQWKDTKTSKEYIVMLYCNQVYVKLSVLSEVKGTAKDYEDWQKIKMQSYDEKNDTYKDYLTDTDFETILFKETEEQEEAISVDVPIFSNVYDEDGNRKTIVGEAAWDEFVEKDIAKTYRVDGIAYGEAFYLATGYKLMMLSSEDGTILAKQIKPVVPTTPEYNTIGGNLLSDDPATAIKSSTGLALRVNGIIITSEHDGKVLLKGLVNNPINFRVITTRPNASETVYYRFRYQKESDTNWTNKYSSQEGWEKITLNDTTDIVWEGLLNQATKYNISIEVTPQSNMDTSTWKVKNAGLVESYVYTSYEVTETPEYQIDVSVSLHTCRRLLVYYDQLLAYQDTVDGNAIYISDYRRFDYFPSDYNLIVDTATKDIITSINYYQNVLVVLTENNIFMLKGKNPYDFALSNINRTIGCRYGWTAKVVGNYLYFMSIEGLYILKSVYNTEDRLNVEEVDFKIKTLFLENPNDYIAYSFKGNYYLVELAPYDYDESGNRVSDNGKIYIYDTYLEAWTTYSSLMLNLNNVLVLGNHVCATERNTNSFLVYPKLQVFDEEFIEYSDGAFYYLDAEDDTKVVRRNDGKLYITTLEEIYTSFGKPYHTKKFKELMLKVMDSHEGKTGLLVTIIVDGAYVVNPEKYEVTVDEETGEVHVEYFTKDNVIRGLNTSYTIETLENVKLPTITELGTSFILGSAKLGDYDISLHKIKYSGKGKTVKYIIEQVDNKFFGILGHSTVYKEKKPAVK